MNSASRLTLPKAGWSAPVIGLLLLPACLSAQVGTHAVRGRVIDRSQNRAVGQAAITLGDSQRATTDANGEFVMRGVRPGSYPLVVEAFGYRTAQTVVRLDGGGDVSVTIRLDPEPIPLDTLAVRPVRVTVRGRVVDRANGQRVPFITIRQGESNATSSNDGGRFILRDVAAGLQTLRAEGFGWLPASVDLDVDRDTVVEIEVDADPITSRRIAAEVEALAERSRSVGVALRVLGRAEIMESRAPTPIEYLKGRGVPIRDCPGMTGRLCIGQGAAAVWIDEVPSCLEILAEYPNEALERIEVIGSRRNTIRAYTRWFIERMTERKVILQPLTPFDRPFTC